MSNRTIDEILGAYEAPRLTEKLYMRGDLIARQQQLEDEYDRVVREIKGEPETDPDLGPANSPLEVRRRKLWKEIQDVKAELDGSAEEFVFRAIGNTKYDALIDAHQPSEEEREQGLEFSPSFMPALISAVSLKPEMTFEQAEAFLAKIPPSEAVKFFGVAISVNRAPVSDPKFRRSSPMEVLHGTSSNTAPSTE